MPVHTRIIDARRTLIVPGNAVETIAYCADLFVSTARGAIAERGRFSIALSGGSTPKAIFERLAKEASALDWSKVELYWSDERAVPPDHSESNYGMAMRDLSKLPITSIFRMQAEKDIEKNALAYENLITTRLDSFDVVTLGMGEDGHIASLFPHTKALDEKKRLVVSHDVPGKGQRMTLTYPGLHRTKALWLFVLGSSKKERLAEVLSPWSQAPSFSVGTPSCPALWICDSAAAV